MMHKVLLVYLSQLIWKENMLKNLTAVQNKE